MIRRMSTAAITTQAITAMGNDRDDQRLIALVTDKVFAAGTFGAVISTRMADLSSQQISPEPMTSLARRTLARRRVQEGRNRFTADSATLTSDTSRKPHRK